MTAQILEAAMLICFGLSWPMNAYKSYKSATAVSTSWQFITLITAGYVAGIAAKFVSGDISWVLIVYFLNLGCLAINWAVYFRNKKLDRERIEQQKSINNNNNVLQVPSNASFPITTPVIGNVLIASDGSEGSLNAIRYVAKCIDPTKTKSIHIVSATEEMSSTATEQAQRAVSQAHEVLETSGIQSSTAVIYGTPAEAIVKETEKHNANLVIMGSRGLSGLQGLILGSVSRNVCNNVGCPVLIVK